MQAQQKAPVQFSVQQNTVDAEFADSLSPISVYRLERFSNTYKKTKDRNMAEF